MQFDIKAAREILAQTPSTLSAFLASKPADWLNARKAPEAFSAIDVVGHLMHAENTDWIPRVRMVLDGRQDVPFAPFDRFGFQHLIAGKSIEQLLAEFARLRQESLVALDEFSIKEAQLDLRGLHPELGLVTLRNLLATWALHDLGHLAQIAKTMANEYREAVGPWRAYLTILD